MRSLTPSSPRAGRLLGAVVTVAALGTAASAAVLGITSAYGGHSAHDASPAAQVSAPAAADAAGGQAAAGGHDMSSMNAGADTGDTGGMAGMASDGVELYAVQTGTLGIVVTDGAGRLLYGSEHDANNPPTSRCTGACAQEWQPLVVPKGQKLDLLGVDARVVGRVGRDDGSSQLTLGGWPVYINRDDDGDLKSAAPDAHGAWFVMTPQGDKIQT